MVSIKISNHGMPLPITATVRSGVAMSICLVSRPEQVINYNKGLERVPGSPLGARGMA